MSTDKNAQEVYLTTPSVLARLLIGFAMRLGMEEMMASISAQVHLQTSKGWSRWSDFLAKNCSQCAKAPSTCDFFNPRTEQLIGSADAESLKNANCWMVEEGRYVTCPCLVYQNQKNVE